MSAHLTLVVGGAPALAQALDATGAFAHVHAVASTDELRRLVQGGALPAAKEQLVFLFADNMADDTGQFPLDALVGKLVMSGRKVIVLGLTPNAQRLVDANRQAGLLTGPFTLNATLGGISGLGLGLVAPVEAAGAYEPFDPVAGPAPDLSAPQPEPAQPAPQQPEPAQPAGGSWGAWGEPAPGEGAWGQAAGSWGQPAPQQPAPQQPAEPTNQPEPAAAPQTAPSSWEAVGQAGMPDAWRTPPAVDRDPEPAAAPAVAQDAPPAGRSLAAAAGRSLADVAGRTAAPAPTEQPTEQTAQQPTDQPAAWQAAAGWDTAPEPEPADTTTAPAARGGLNVVHQQLRPRRGWVVTITSSKGGTGKTSLTTNLAAFLGLQMRAEGKTVCLVDANYGQADVGKVLDQYAPNIVDLARDPSSVHVDRIMQSLVHRPDLNMSVLLGPARPKDANPVYITPKLYNQVLDVLTELYDYVLIDTQVAERFSSMHSEFSVPRADRLIIPVNPNLATLMNADAWLRSICEPVHTGGLGYDESKVGIMLNMAMEGVDCDVDDVMRELGSWTFVGAIPMTPVWQKALNNNDLVATYNYEELNQAFAAVLYAATGEPALMQHGTAAATPADDGLASKLKGLLKRRAR